MKKRLCVGLAFACFLGGTSLSSCSTKTKEDSYYEITAEYIPETNSVAGTVKCRFVNNDEREIDELLFNLWGNAYREDAIYRPVSSAYESTAFYAGKSYGNMTITSVDGGGNWEIVGDDANILSVPLSSSLGIGESVTLDIGFITKLAKVNHRTGETKHTVNLGNFYPILCFDGTDGFVTCPYFSDGEPFVSESADFLVRMTTPKDYVVASSGMVENQSNLESKTETVLSQQNARDFALVLSNEFSVERCKVGDTEISYYYYKDETPTAHLAVAKEAFSFYEEKFGDYPYPTYTLAQTGFCYGGMEYACLSMLGDHLTEEEYVSTIVHETAHQWWYNIVGSDSIENGWQDEGLASYSAVLFFDSHESYGRTEADLIASATERYRTFYDVYDRVFGEADTRMTRHLKEYISEYEYASIAYDKGMILFHTLNQSVGSKRFYKALQNYVQSAKYRVATVQDLIGAFEKAGVDVQGLFSSFLEGKVVI